ncbi:glycosyltransferase family 9 protein [Aliikangiella coralliicola]|uniref:Glycosyltransferase family 9 protein n=1 Tax=Aliikangiella coralliicola TaxID=2592383 RepID=A0A545TW49_9GAMM|nr:glycosyltransferase family 9 protein [Aliikangiella coralliicola]TQV81424.1 glycosyltransferase family 9 protein [Aliikangiella coralliicola]
MLSKIQTIHSICILRLSAIGDVCHAVACVQAIQQRWPEVKITWVIGKVEWQLLKGLPGVDFVIFDKKAGLRGYLDLKAQLKDKQFDVLLHMQVALRASLATLCIRAKEKWGFDRSRAKEAQWIFTNRKISGQVRPHVADGFLGFAKAIGVADEYQLKWQMPIEQQDITWQKTQLGHIGKYIVISPAASKVERNWLPERYAQFADYANKKGLAVLICGGPTEIEKQLAAEIESHCQCDPINLVGKTSLKQLLVVLKQAQMVLAPDTGPAHMAVTVGTPVIGLYVHSNPDRTGPYAYQNYVVSCYEQLLKEQSGATSQEHRWGKRVKGEHLMERIELDAVIESFERMVTDFDLLADNSRIE